MNMESYSGFEDEDWCIDIEDEDDEEFIDFGMMIAFPRIAKRIRERVDHFTFWRDSEFFFRFRLNKETVRYLVSLIQDKISSKTSR